MRSFQWFFVRILICICGVCSKWLGCHLSAHRATFNLMYTCIDTWHQGRVIVSKMFLHFIWFFFFLSIVGLAALPSPSANRFYILFVTWEKRNGIDCLIVKGDYHLLVFAFRESLRRSRCTERGMRAMQTTEAEEIVCDGESVIDECSSQRLDQTNQ